ncbi:MAG TPA: triple tyrosine motif-containing protein, partial [Chitinophagaceae bacterium]
FNSRATAADTSKNVRSFFKKYTVSEGFSGGGTYENSITQDTAGNIWMSGTDRVTVYHPEGDIPDTIPPVIQLSNIALFGENINWLELEKKKDSVFILSNGTRLENFNFSNLTPWYNQPENLQLSYDNNYITFQFIGITMNRPKEVRYQYFLEGLDDNWSAITGKSEATYNNLPHGKYTFKTKAVNSEGYWSNELNYSFVILPPWWSTWWANVSYVFLFLVVLALFIKLREKTLRKEKLLLEEKIIVRTQELKKEKDKVESTLVQVKELQEQLVEKEKMNERLRISRELHDDIGSTLGSISIYSEVAKKHSGKSDADEVLTKIGLASRELIEKMSDIVWSLNPNNESFEQLQNRMMTFAAMILTPQNILYDFIAGEQLKKLQLTSEQRKNIFLIFKEALHNIVKYAVCKKAGIMLNLHKNNLIMTIRDDGKGFDTSQDLQNMRVTATYLGGNGIKNMNARANDMNAKISISSKINDGTIVQLILPL